MWMRRTCCEWREVKGGRREKKIKMETGGKG